MNQKIEELIQTLKGVEEEMEAEFRKKREEFRYTIEEKRIRFAEEVILQGRQLRMGLLLYLREARPFNVLTAPVIYSGFVPLLFLDLFVTLYQTVCFPAYGIPKARRGDYMVFDRGDLPYLNALEKFNCFYCSYANGLAAYFREVAARTEQYWCPIKHARRIRSAHHLYPRFFEYGDAESFRKGLERIRTRYEKNETSQGRS
jgi:hypothetical protein